MGTGFPIWGGENVLEINMMVAQHSEQTQCHLIVHLKMVNVTLYSFTSKKKKNFKPGINSLLWLTGTLLYP